MKGSRTVNTQKLMKKLLALPAIETVDGKRVIELSRVLEAVRASSIIEKDIPNEDKLTMRDLEAGVNLLKSNAEKARVPAGRYCYHCRHARLTFAFGNMKWAIYCAKLNEFHNKGFNCHMWERRIYHE